MPEDLIFDRPKKGFKPFWAVTITVVVIVAAASGGYYYLSKKHEKDVAAYKSQIDDLNRSLTALKAEKTAADASASASSSSSTLKTYTNTKYSYTFQYPKADDVIDYLYDAQTKTKVNKFDNVIVSTSAIPENAFRTESDMSVQYFMISERDEVFGLSEIASDSDGETVSDVTVAGESGWKVVFTHASILDETFSTVYYFNHGSHGFQISIKNSDASGTHDSAVDAIVASIKFSG